MRTHHLDVPSISSLSVLKQLIKTIPGKQQHTLPIQGQPSNINRAPLISTIEIMKLSTALLLLATVSAVGELVSVESALISERNVRPHLLSRVPCALYFFRWRKRKGKERTVSNVDKNGAYYSLTSSAVIISFVHRFASSLRTLRRHRLHPPTQVTAAGEAGAAATWLFVMTEAVTIRKNASSTLKKNSRVNSGYASSKTAAAAGDQNQAAG